jgi:hypothetical protein
MLYIVKFHDKDQDWYMEWGLDAPATEGMSLEDFKQYYCYRFGKHRLLAAREWLIRAGETGIGAPAGETLDELIAQNRAGKGGTHLTKDQIIEWYVRHPQEVRRGEPCPIEGTARPKDSYIEELLNQIDLQLKRLQKEDKGREGRDGR